MPSYDIDGKLTTDGYTLTQINGIGNKNNKDCMDTTCAKVSCGGGVVTLIVLMITTAL